MHIFNSYQLIKYTPVHRTGVILVYSEIKVGGCCVCVREGEKLCVCACVNGQLRERLIKGNYDLWD